MSSIADDKFSTDFLVSDKIALLKTAKVDCCDFDIRVIFRSPHRRPIMVLIQVKRIDPRPAVPLGETKRDFHHVKQTAFLPAVEEARSTAGEAADKVQQWSS